MSQPGHPLSAKVGAGLFGPIPTRENKNGKEEDSEENEKSG